MVAYNPPQSKSVVNLPESLVDRYVAAGWTPVERQTAKKDDEADEQPVRRAPGRKRK